jgi:HlyD family secretion protein
VVQAGTPLFTVGHPDSLEVRVDVLSSDAVQISKGTPVEVVRWGGDRTLHGTVRVVEPMGRTEVSALAGCCTLEFECSPGQFIGGNHPT